MKHIFNTLKTCLMSKMSRERILFLSAILFLIFLLVRNKISSGDTQKDFDDKLRIEKTRSGKIQYEKDLLILSEKDLKQRNKQLYDELKDQKGKVIYINQTGTVVKSDTIYLNNTLETYTNGVFGLKWSQDTTFSPGNFRKIGGESKFRLNMGQITPMKTVISHCEFGISIITGIKESGKNIEIFVRSNYPGFSVTSIEGSMVDPKKSKVLKSYFKPKKWGLGPQMGVTMLQGRAMPYLGVGLSYNIIRF